MSGRDGTYALGAAARGGIVTGIDVSPEMLDAARARAETKGLALTLRPGSAEDLPFADGSFDVVFLVAVLCMVSDAATVVREAARVLAPGGRVIVADLHRWSASAARRRARAWPADVAPRKVPPDARLWRQARFWSARARGPSRPRSRPRSGIPTSRWREGDRCVERAVCSHSCFAGAA